ncbi:SDR family NAD(P)-dependent oxidoreductase [Photorhabdus laumondii]|uniref:SDR family NAD(P)-dependent oxidoreductase n=1 Tax=Photorhabdus laumondii TaxID=2218628 RepID=UPI0025B1116F|nr:SDR family NAD(P)-dependent oxidoreductase [Photorhabdus laumondii]
MEYTGISQTAIDSLVFSPDWEILPLVQTPAFASLRIFLIPPSQSVMWQEMTVAFPNDEVYLLDPETIARVVEERQNNTDLHLLFVTRTPWRAGVPDEDIRAFFNLIKMLRNAPYVSLDVFTDKAITSPMFDSVTHPVDGVYVGLAQTLAKERPEWKVRSFSLQKLTSDTLRTLLDSTLPTMPGIPVCIAGGQYGSARMLPETLDGWPEYSAFKQQGTYVIIGGSGGLGGMLAEYLAARYQARLVIVGRRPQDHGQIKRLKQLGAKEIAYHQVDLNDSGALQAALDCYPVVNGVVHSALVLEDASLAAMNEDTLFNVLRPKLHGTYNLVKALKGRVIDFCLFFSSIQSYIANPGQANYTAACVAKDAFADLMYNGLALNSKIINWGFWGSIGVVATDQYRERMKKLQIGSIEAKEGLAIIERFLVSDCSQISVVKGSDMALKRLQITPHATKIASSFAKENTLVELADSDGLVPTFCTADAFVVRNQALSTNLQEYARWRLNQVALPDSTLSKFDKLIKAIRNIPPGYCLGRKELLREYPELSGHIKLLDQCLTHLPDILQGKTDPLSVLFPDGSFELVEPVYRDNPIADYFNRVVARIIANYQKANANRPLRIIEIGAGTGSTTQFVLPELTLGNVSYTFTDLSFAFLNKARRRFMKYPFIEYKICNIENPQVFDVPFDVVIATNVIHATVDLPNTLRQVRSMLRDNGIFVLNEITSCQDYATLTFGLTDGWWLSQDPYRIANSPLLSGNSWRRLMLQAGFDKVDAHGSDDQQVMVGFVGSATPKVEALGDSKASQAQIEDFLRQVIADVLHFDSSEIESDMPFNEMGVDSLISMELLKPIKEKIGYLPATILFEYPTICQLAGHLLQSGVTWQEPLAEQLGAAPVESFGPDATADRINNNNDDIIVRVRAIIANTMMMELADIDPDTPFQEYGIDSIISLELIRPLKEIFGYLPATVLFEYPTLKQLSKHLETKFGQMTSTSTSEQARNSVPDKHSAKYRKMDAALEASREQGDIAIIGMTARLPQAEDVNAFWMNLYNGRDCTDVIPSERWCQEGFITPVPVNGRGSYTNRGAFIDDIDAFDHIFFHLTPNEAARMDPQERILLEQTYRVMLDAGYSRKQLAGSDTAMFVGVMNGDYAWHTPADKTVMLATSLFWSMANRVSYHFDWHGPSMAVDTACSASLTALHLACQALKNGDCDQAVVGGVNLITHPRHYELLCSLHMLSRSEQCKPFGAQSDGFVDGEGIVCLMVKRAEDAVRDKDRIYAFIKGSSINAGGRANGYTAPNPDAQVALIRKALKAARVSPQEVGYVEAHGTGTELGDPIELRALTKGYGGAALQSIRLGSVKSNVGHLESAAGLCGVLKTVLQMRYGEMVPSLHAKQLNPHLDFAQSPFVLNRERQTWPEATPLMSAVSSFGAGGSNAHVILQGVVQIPLTNENVRGEEDREGYVIPLSHHSSAGLQLSLDRLRYWLQQNRVDMVALAYTLACARDHDKHRIAIVCRDQEDLIRQLSVDLQHRSSLRGKKCKESSALPVQLACNNAQNIAVLYESGADLPWFRYYPHRKLVQVPEYVFIRHRHWINSQESNFKGLSSLINAHRIKGETMVPAAWTLSALCEKADDGGFVDIMWKGKITVPESVDLIEEEGRILFVGRDDRQEFCSAERVPASDIAISSVIENERGMIDAKMLVMDDAQWVSQQNIYADFKRRGYDYGPALQGVRWAQVKPGVVRAFLHADRDWGRLVSPALLDAGLQLAILMPVADYSKIERSAVFMPYHLGKLVIRRLPDNEAVYCYCVERDAGHSVRARIFDFYFTDLQGQVLIKLEELVSVVILPGAKGASGESRRPSRSTAKFEVFDIN